MINHSVGEFSRPSEEFRSPHHALTAFLIRYLAASRHRSVDRGKEEKGVNKISTGIVVEFLRLLDGNCPPVVLYTTYFKELFRDISIENCQEKNFLRIIIYAIISSPNAVVRYQTT